MVPVLVLTPEAVVNVDVGASGVVLCVARGIPTPEITWFQDGVEIQNGSMNFNIVNSPFNDTDDTIQSFLELCPVEAGNAGTYTCQALNMYGNQTAMFEVVVNEGRSLIAHDWSDIHPNPYMHRECHNI